MTGKSKYSDRLQKAVVRYIIKGCDIVDIAKTQNMEFPYPSKRTLSRWVDAWKPEILEEIAERQHKQDEARRRQLRQDKKKVRQDEKSTFSIPIRFLSDVEEALNTHLSAYNKSKYGAAVRRRERIHTILEIIKEVDK